jgi:DNA polymerase III gamma/tau subunit
MKDYSDRVGDMKIFIRGLIDYFRSGLLVKKLPFDHDLVDFTESRYKRIKELFAKVEPDAIIRLMNLAIDTYRELKGDVEENFVIEIALFKMLDYKNMIPLSQIRQELLAATGGQGVQPVQRVSIPETPKKQAPEPVPAQSNATHHKIETPALKQEDLPKLSNPEEALKAVLSKSVLMRVMIDHIESVITNGKNIRVKMTNQKSCEYLAAMKRNIEKDMKDALQTEVMVDFVMDQPEEKPLFDDRDASASQSTSVAEELSEDEIIPATPKKETVQTAERTNEGNMPSNAIQSLFGGEIKR